MAAADLKRFDLSEFTSLFTAASKGVSGNQENDAMEGPCRLYGIIAHGEEGPTDAIEYIKFWDDIAPSPGTTAPDFQFPIALGKTRFIPVNGVDGVVFDNGLSFGATDEKGTPCTTNPGTDLPVTLIVKEGAS